MLNNEQIEQVKQQLENTKSAADLVEQDPQLGQLLAKHFTLFVGADVCFAEVEIAVKNAASQVLLTGRFFSATSATRACLAGDFQ